MERGLLSSERALIEGCPSDIRCVDWAQNPVALQFHIFIVMVIDELHLPNLDLSKKYNLVEILTELGIRELFSTQADLSGIIGVKNITVSQVRQETWFTHLGS